MNILDKIVLTKKKEVEEAKLKTSVSEMEKTFYYKSDTFSLKGNLLNPQKTGIIAEFKRKSPSKGIINDNANIKDVTMGYTAAGASGLSVLTDEQYFGGMLEDLSVARRSNDNALLRKDFIVDEYQIIEAKSHGADVVLLIAAVLSKRKLVQFAKLAKSIGLEVLMEVHSKEELEKINEFVDIVGVNNRNLKTFQVDVKQSLSLAKFIPDNFLKISESGISKPETIIQLKDAGFNGFLIGEQFMKTSDPVEAFNDFIKNIYDLLDAGQSK